MVKDIQQASRQLNKRQMTWFRDDPMYLWLDATKPKEELVETISSSLLQPPHEGKVHYYTSPHRCTLAQSMQFCASILDQLAFFSLLDDMLRDCVLEELVRAVFSSSLGCVLFSMAQQQF